MTVKAHIFGPRKYIIISINFKVTSLTNKSKNPTT